MSGSLLPRFASLSHSQQPFPMIALHDVQKRFDEGAVNVPVLRGIDIEIGSGEVAALLGPSGCGKSTLLNILGCLDRPSAGEYKLAGRDVSQLSREEEAWVRLHHIGFVFQSFHLIAHSTALENVELPMYYAGVPRREREERAHAMLARVGLLDLHREHLEKAFGAEDEHTLFAPVNLLNAEQVDGAVKAGAGKFGRIDSLVNLAGAFRMGDPVHATKDADWNFLLDVNVRRLLNTVRAVVPRMIERGGGKIVNIGAFAAQKGIAQMGAYVAAKSVVIRLTESMAAELRDKNINVNCVLPTIIDTPANRADMPKADPKRWVAPQDLANVILFLASDAARAVHGATLPVTSLS